MVADAEANKAADAERKARCDKKASVENECYAAKETLGEGAGGEVDQLLERLGDPDADDEVIEAVAREVAALMAREAPAPAPAPRPEPAVEEVD